MTLANLTFLNTRPKHQARVLTQLLCERGAGVTEIPMLDIKQVASPMVLGAIMDQYRGGEWVVFTSANGVYSVLPFVSCEGVQTAVIGKKTALAMQDFSKMPDFVSAQARSSYFAREFLDYLSRRHSSGEKLPKILLCRGKQASSDLPRILREGGLKVEELTVYESVLPDIGPSEQEKLGLCFGLGLKDPRDKVIITGPEIHPKSATVVDMVLLTSTEAAKNLISVLRRSFPNEQGWQDKVLKKPVAVIGPETAEGAAKLGFEVIISAEQASVESLVSAVERYFRKKD